MDQKKKRIFDLSVSVLTLFILSAVFVGCLIGLIFSLKTPSYKSIEYSLDLLPKKYPRNIERFEVTKQRIRYTINHGQAKEHWDFPIESISGLTEYKAESWSLSDKDSLIVNFKKTFLLLVVFSVLTIIFGTVDWLLGKDVLRKMLQKGDLPQEEEATLF